MEVRTRVKETQEDRCGWRRTARPCSSGDPVAAGTPAAPTPRKPDDIEQLMYHTMHDAFYKDFVSSGCFKALLDLALGEGGLAFAAIMSGTPISVPQNT